MADEVRSALLDAEALDRLAGAAETAPGAAVTDFADPRYAAALARAEVLLTCWGCPPLDEAALERMPELRAVVHAAGSVKGLVTEACWRRGIAVSTAASANAVPVAEYTVAAILFAGKRVLPTAHTYARERGGWGFEVLGGPHRGNYGRVVGVVGASRIGRLVVERLRPFDFHVLLHDPCIGAKEAAGLGVEAVGPDELAARSDVVTLHAPALPQTRHLFDRRRLALLRDGATLINTARGSLVDTAALTEELVHGRIDAVLDVTDPEPLPGDSPLYGLPNVLLTPHVAGSLGNELGRLAHAALAELERYAAGLPFEEPVERGALDRSA
ncbi:glycerate dehydrogenase [Wenjunlia tyrosinilytica]|uniref:Glycerate dehydrogenase n=2 Tax=Wenjunlia tyrosinilytica TaxID=1544741 RepID=A0A918DYI2_9ACTN|nr:glycerate dehydrogenase [Wenjunlia tyrosinilytica]